MTPYYTDESVTLLHGDCLAVMASLPDNSVDAVVTDPPYGLGFMGQKWDTYANETGRAGSSKDHKFDHVGGNHNPSNSADASRTRRVEAQRFGEWCSLWTVEAFRVLKPGGHLLAFGGTRTWHRLAVAVEDAGFEVRDSIAWLYGSGFPKSLDVSKAIDKGAGALREVVGSKVGLPGYHLSGKGKAGPAYGDRLQQVTTEQRAAAAEVTAPATPAAQQWQGWGTALKPAFEPIVVARKPVAGTVAANVLAHGTGALNIDGCRVGTSGGGNACPGGDLCKCVTSGVSYSPTKHPVRREGDFGRWPANVLLDGDQADELDRQSGTLTSGSWNGKRNVPKFGNGGVYNDLQGVEEEGKVGDSGGASRFFPVFRYEAKAPTAERPRDGDTAHPTVKPLDLMRWLVRLVTPPGGTVLEPFAGSGTTAEACVIEGFRCIAIEREAAYLPLIVARLSKPIQPDLFGGAA